MVYVTDWACWKGYRSLKNDQGWFQGGDWFICGGYACAKKFDSTRGNDNLNMSLWARTNTQTHTKKPIPLLPLICHLCASQQKTFLQNRTGHWELWDLQGLCVHHLQVCGRTHVWISDYRLNRTWASRAQSLCRCTVLCITLSLWIMSVFGSSVLWLGRIVILLCVTAQPDKALRVWPTPPAHKHCCGFWSLNALTRAVLIAVVLVLLL